MWARALVRALGCIVMLICCAPEGCASFIGWHDDEVAEIGVMLDAKCVGIRYSSPQMERGFPLKQISHFCYCAFSIEDMSMKFSLAREHSCSVWLSYPCDRKIKALRYFPYPNFTFGKYQNIIGWSIAVVGEIDSKFKSPSLTLSDVVAIVGGNISAHLTRPEIPLIFHDNFIVGDGRGDSSCDAFHGICGPRSLGNGFLHIAALRGRGLLQPFGRDGEGYGKPRDYSGGDKRQKPVMFIQSDGFAGEDDAAMAEEAAEGGDLVIKILVLGAVLYGVNAMVKRWSRRKEKKNEDDS